MAERLKPCPFHDAVLEIRVVGPAGDGWWVSCGCGAEGPPGLSEAKAIAAWNHRDEAPIAESLFIAPCVLDCVARKPRS